MKLRPNFRTIVGVATLGSLKTKVLKGKVQATDSVSKAMYTTFKKVTLDTTLEKLDRILDKEHFALVVHAQRLCEYESTMYHRFLFFRHSLFSPGLSRRDKRIGYSFLRHSLFSHFLNSWP